MANGISRIVVNDAQPFGTGNHKKQVSIIFGMSPTCLGRPSFHEAAFEVARCFSQCFFDAILS